MDEYSSLFDDRGGESQSYLTDVFLEHIADATDGDHSSLKMTELVIFGLANKRDGKFLPLVTASPGRWKVEGSIELPKSEKGIVIIGKSKEGRDMGFTHLDCIDIRNGATSTGTGTNAGYFKAKALVLIGGIYRVYPGYEDMQSEAVPDNIVGDMRNTIQAYDEGERYPDLAEQC
ncbi:hypothetical protein EST38_g8088 [Candolleomyces aberdarensis]|uniref:Uncharacterized protein n=1 Tax=Candolleomyces aberdarensis TaxID=2316362 RepID=A0A4Q2DFP2_9AGAR|nr:hypothetical protein EST38_g8088 [Candolleomyces aberdarensis]